MITCYIVDNERCAVARLREFIGQTHGLILAGWSEDPLKAVEDLISPDPPALTFMDIEMPGLSGLDLSAQVKGYTSVIFTTAHSRHAVTAFELGALDYLIKPFSYPRFLQAVNHLRPHPCTAKEFIYIKSDCRGKWIRVVLKDIDYIRVSQNYLEIFMGPVKYLTYLTLWEMEEALPAGCFLRIHKSAIVNLAKIRSVENGAVILEDDTLVIIGERYREKLQEQLSAWAVVSRRRLS